LELAPLASAFHEQQFHLRELCGRADVLAEIDAWIAAHAGGGTLVIVGGPGSGKSAIAAEVARRHDAALHMMKAHRAPARFVGSLVAQLLERANIRGAMPVCADVDDLRNALVDALEALATTYGSATLVIDGLDELDGESALDVLPRHPPPGVRVILTTRPDQALLRRLRRTIGELDEQALPPLAPAEVQAVLDKRAGRTVDPAATACIAVMTGGLPILVRRAGDALRGDADGFEMGALPATLSAFSADAYRAIRGTGDDAGDRGRIFQLLSVAREALGAAELLSLLALDGRGTSLERCRDHLEAMSSWLVEHDAGSFRPFHEALAEHVRTEVLGEEGTRACHALLATWTAAEWKSPHAVRHHVRYLLAAGDLEQAREVLERPETLTAKLVHELVFELVRELDLAASPLAPAVRRHAHFLARHPFALGSVVDADVPGIRVRAARPASAAAIRAGELFVLRGHEGEVYDVAVAPGGKRLASVGADATLRLWDLASAGPVRTIPTRARRALSVAIAGDGRIACGTDGAGVLVLDEAGEEVRRSGDGTVAWSVDWSPGGKLAIGMRTGEVEIRASSGELVGTFATDGIVTAVKFSRDGERLAVATTRGKIVVTDGSGGTVFRAGPLADTPWALAWTLERTLVAACADGLVREWSDDGRPARERTVADDRLYGAALSSDGALLALVGKRGVMHLGAPDADELVAAAAHDDAIHAVAFADIGECVVTASSDGTVRGFSPAAVQAARPESERPHALALSPGGELIAIGLYDGAIRLVDAAARSEVCRLEAHTSRVTGLALSRDGALLASASQDGVAKVFRVAPLQSKTGKRTPVAELVGHEGAVTCIDVVGAGGRATTGSRDRTARVWSVFGARQLCAIPHDETVIAVASDEAGEHGATLTRDGAVLVFRIEDGAIVARAPGAPAGEAGEERQGLAFCAADMLRVRDRRGAWTVWRTSGASLVRVDRRAAQALLPRYTLRTDARWQESVVLDSAGRAVTAFPGFLALATSDADGTRFAGWWAGDVQILDVEDASPAMAGTS
jgi:WD40 repeat protein